jgi:hypothetical protein
MLLLRQEGALVAIASTVDHTSRLYRGFHEAGHAIVALGMGADVEFVELFAEGGGRCRINRTDDKLLAKCIAAGGYAVEFLLYKAGRLRTPNGVGLTDRDFINLGMANAWDDKKSFFGADHAGEDKAWPAELDTEFMTFGYQRVAPPLQSKMAVIEAIALRLDAASRLTGDEVRGILAEYGLSG